MTTLATRELSVLRPAVENGSFAGVDGSTGALLVADAASVFVLPTDATTWQSTVDDGASVALGRSGGVAISTPNGLWCLGGKNDVGEPVAEVTRLVWSDGNVVAYDVPSLPTPTVSSTNGGAALVGSTVFVTDGQKLWSRQIDATDGPWRERSLPAKFLNHVTLAEQMDDLFVFGLATGSDSDVPAAYRAVATNEQHANEQIVWTSLEAPEGMPAAPRCVSFGLAHVLVVGAADGKTLLYHAITDRWLTLTDDAFVLDSNAIIVAYGNEAWVLGANTTQAIQPAQLATNYSWLDNLVVAAYLLGMIGIGWYFTKRENSSNDFFRGGQRIPWWAAGMSLFATGASAISLAGMPGMGFGTDWTYFTISIASVICLPIAIFVMAPLVRRLQIKTSNEYLERRFGVTSRLFASAIWMFTQVAARIASVMLLSAIALEAITDMDIVTAIIVMGVVTTIYTYLGGLEAVIWTDTVQGFVMVATVVGCLLLALWKLDQPPAESWSALQEYDKLHMFDFSASLIGPTTFIFFVHVLFSTFGGISDQNFVQRVQSTPNLKQTKLAVMMQMAVAVPINVLLFALGSALWLFYRDRPDSLSPTIVNNDGVFPFFAAQQLPIGVSGIVVAALLAATMSTVSSSICAVSDLGTNDFYRRFKRDATDHQCLVLGRILTAIVGASGTIAAIILASIEDVKSVWDLAIMVTGLISSSVLGLFMLGLLTRRTHELGALIGAAAGMGTIIYLRTYSPITFWLYVVIGPLVTIGVGVLASFLLPGTPRDTRGLTVYSLRHAGAPEENSVV